MHTFEKTYDVVVAGAGVAGCAAALAAARMGLRVALIEKTILPGGLATSGVVNIYLPLCDGNGHQVTFGIAEELLRRSIQYGPGDIPAGWRAERDAPEARRLHARFAPAAFVLALDEVLDEAGVDVWYDTVICQTMVQDGRVTGIVVENKSGRGAVHAACTVDATGDADVAARAGAAYEESDNWLSIWSIIHTETDVRNARRECGAACVQMLCCGAGSNGHNHPAGTPKWHGTNGRQVSGFVRATRATLRRALAERQAAAGSNGRTQIFPVALPCMAQFRTTRAVTGRVTLRDGEHTLRREDSIGLAADWRKPGFVWEIPYGALVPQRVRGLLTAGRCIASTGDAWEVTRVIPAAALTGEAAGCAAALAAQSGATPDALPITQLQHALRTRGFLLHREEISAAQA